MGAIVSPSLQLQPSERAADPASLCPSKGQQYKNTNGVYFNIYCGIDFNSGSQYDLDTSNTDSLASCLNHCSEYNKGTNGDPALQCNGAVWNEDSHGCYLKNGNGNQFSSPERQTGFLYRPGPSGSNCPTDDGKTYTEDDYKTTYKLKCNTNLAKNNIQCSTESTLAHCMSDCSRYNIERDPTQVTCQGVSLREDTCCLRTTADADDAAPYAIDSAVLVEDPDPSSPILSSTTLSTSSSSVVSSDTGTSSAPSSSSIRPLSSSSSTSSSSRSSSSKILTSTTPRSSSTTKSSSSRKSSSSKKPSSTRTPTKSSTSSSIPKSTCPTEPKTRQCKADTTCCNGASKFDYCAKNSSSKGGVHQFGFNVPKGTKCDVQDNIVASNSKGTCQMTGTLECDTKGNVFMKCIVGRGEVEFGKVPKGGKCVKGKVVAV